MSEEGISVSSQSPLVLATAAGAIGLATVLYRKRNILTAAVHRGPYGSANTSGLNRTISRLVLESTRRAIAATWYPNTPFHLLAKGRIDNNGHAISGGVRDTARQMLRAAVQSQGYNIVELSPASITAGRNAANIHQHYAAGDLSTEISNPLDLPSNSVILAIDCDYYTTPSYLLGFGVPVMLYTFSPRAVSGRDGDCRYRIRDDNVMYEVDGGGVWSHPVWDWTAPGEFTTTPIVGSRFFGKVCRWILSSVGITQFIVHKIHHARPFDGKNGIFSPERAIVWCLPQYTYWTHSWLSHEINTRIIRQMRFSDPARPGWNRTTFNTPKGVMTSLGRQGDDASVIISKYEFDVLMGCQSAQSVTSRMISMDKDKSHGPGDIALLGQYFSGTASVTAKHDSPYVVSPADVPVHWVPTSYADVPQTTMRTYSKPLVSQPALAPMIGRWETLVHSLEKRVSYAFNTTRPPLTAIALCQEFAELLVPVAHTGRPFTLEATIDMFDKPKQRALVAGVLDTLDVAPRALIESFVKNEPSMKTPRVISSWHDVRWLLEMSQFQYALKEQVLLDQRNEHWFYPGRTPIEIAEGVQEFVLSCEGNVAETDYSNMDGLTSQFLQEMVSFAIELRHFAPEFHKALKRLHSNLIKAPARSKSFGFKYNAGVGVKSGSPTTTNHNTIHSAFHEYCAIRRVWPNLAPFEAFQLLGPKCGDDGLTRTELANAFEKVVKSWGMKLKVEKCKPETGVTFLARVFPDPINTTTSFQDPLRTLRKLHLTTRNRNVPLADAAVDRVSGYLITDKYTPIISEYCHAISQFYERQANSEEKRAKRACVNNEQNYWARHGGENCWPQDPRDRTLMLDCISERIGLDKATLEEFISRLESGTFDPWQLRPLGVDAESPYDETLDDDAQLGLDWVDDRQIEQTPGKLSHRLNVSNATQSAASGRVVSLAQDEHARASELAGSAEERRSGSQQRSGGSRRVHSEGRQNRAKRGNDAFGKAHLQAPDTRRRGPRNRRSQIPGAAAPTRAATTPASERAQAETTEGQTNRPSSSGTRQWATKYNLNAKPFKPQQSPESKPGPSSRQD